MEPKKLWNCTNFRYPTDEQSRLFKVVTSNNNLPSFLLDLNITLLFPPNPIHRKQPSPVSPLQTP